MLQEQATPDRIRTWRRELGISQAQLAREAGMSLIGLSQIEAGKRWPKGTTIDKLLRAFSRLKMVQFASALEPLDGPAELGKDAPSMYDLFISWRAILPDLNRLALQVTSRFSGKHQVMTAMEALESLRGFYDTFDFKPIPPGEVTQDATPMAWAAARHTTPDLYQTLLAGLLKGDGGT